MALCCCRVCMLPASKKHRKKWKKKMKWNRSREHTGSLFPNLPSHNTTTHFSGTGLAASEIYHLPKTPPKKQQQFIGTGLPVIVLPPLQGQVLSSKTPFNTSELCLLLHLVLTISQMHYHFLWGSVVRIGVIVLGSLPVLGVIIIEGSSPLMILSSQPTLPKLLTITFVCFRNRHSSYRYLTKSKLKSQVPPLCLLL